MHAGFLIVYHSMIKTFPSLYVRCFTCGLALLTSACGGGSSAAAPQVSNAPVISGFSPSAETATSTVVVTGSNLSGVTAVKFGAIPASSFSVDAAGNLSAVVPTGVQPGPIVVQTPYGSGSSVQPFTPIVVPSQANAMHLVWHDDFDGSSLDATKWHIVTGIRDDATLTSNAVSVASGSLSIKTYTDQSTNFTGFIDTNGKFSYTFGYAEARVKFADSPGGHSAFWLQSNNNKANALKSAAAGNEIDIVEHRATDSVGTDIRQGYVANLHWNGYGSAGSAAPAQSLSGGLQSISLNDSFATNWHTFGVLWSPFGYQFFLDGKQYWSANDGVSLAPEFIRLTSEIKNASWAGKFQQEVTDPCPQLQQISKSTGYVSGSKVCGNCSA